MADGIHTYQRTVKLPCYGVADGRPFKTHLDAKLKETITELTTHASRPKWKPEPDEAGNLVGVLSAGAYEIKLRTIFGQNTSFIGETRQTFISYGMLMESRLMERTGWLAENLGLTIKIAGAVIGSAVFFAVLDLSMQARGPGNTSVTLLVLAVAAGAWCGSIIGGMIGTRLEQETLRRARSGEGAADVEQFWKTLVKKFETLTQDYEKA